MQINGGETVATVDGLPITWNGKFVTSSLTADAYADAFTTQGAPAFVPQPTSQKRRFVALVRRIRASSPVAAQQTVLVPPTIPQALTQPRRLRGPLARRSNLVTPVPTQFPPFPHAVTSQPRRARGLLRRRVRPTETVPPQFNPPFPHAVVSQPRRARGLLRRRVRPTETVTPQQTIPTNPDIIFSGSQRRAMRGTRVRRAQPVNFVQPQQNPPIIPTSIAPARRVRGLLARRGRGAAPVAAQDAPIAARSTRRRTVFVRRGRHAVVVPAQDRPLPTAARRGRPAPRARRGPRTSFVPSLTVVINPPFVRPFIGQPRRLRGLLPRRPRLISPPWAALFSPGVPSGLSGLVTPSEFLGTSSPNVGSDGLVLVDADTLALFNADTLLLGDTPTAAGGQSSPSQAGGTVRPTQTPGTSNPR